MVRRTKQINEPLNRGVEGAVGTAGTPNSKISLRWPQYIAA